MGNTRMNETDILYPTDVIGRFEGTVTLTPTMNLRYVKTANGKKLQQLFIDNFGKEHWEYIKEEEIK